MTDKLLKASCYLELAAITSTYYPDKITGFKVSKLYQNIPTSSVGTIIKVEFEAPPELFAPKTFKVSLDDGVAGAIADLQAWTT